MPDDSSSPSIPYQAFRLIVYKVKHWVKDRRCLFITIVNRHLYKKRESDVFEHRWVNQKMQSGAKTDWVVKTCHSHSKIARISTLSPLLTGQYLHLLLIPVTVLASKLLCSRSRMAPSTSGATRLLSGPTNITSLLWMEELQNEATGYRWP